MNIIKVGGAIVEDPTSLAILLDQFAKIQGPKILVHGGGRTATALASRLGIQSHIIGGRRITDEQTLRIVTMVYAGLVNKNIVAQLQARNINAIGLTGADMNILRAHRRPVTPDGIDYGYVGDVDSADPQPLLTLIHNGATPVIAPLTHDQKGQLLNINADTMAQTIAVALTATPTHLTYCFELPGVMRSPDDPNSLIPHITPTSLHQLIADRIVTGGMIPKLQNAIAAIHSGVTSVRITSYTDLTAGTIITE